MSPPTTPCQWSRQDRDHFLTVVSDALWTEDYAHFTLNNVGFPRWRIPRWNNPVTFWDQVFVDIENGVLSCLCVLFDEFTARFSFNRKLEGLRERHPCDRVVRSGVVVKPRGRVMAGGPPPAATVPRTEITGRVADWLLEAAASGGNAGCVGLTGLGGIGKSVIAGLAAEDPRIVEVFGERIDWLTLGPRCTDGRLIRLFADHESRITGTGSAYRTVEVAAQSFMRARKERPWLLVMDDVWQPEQNELLPYGDGVVRLVTASKHSVLPPGSIRVEVNPMDEDESLELLMHSFDGKPVPSAARSIVARTGGWPLLLSLVNRTLVDRRLDNIELEPAARQVDNQLGRWGPAALDVGSLDDRNRAVEATMRVSLDALNRHLPVGEQRFVELGRLESPVIDRASLEKYWWDTAGMSARDTDKLCRQLNGLSLARYDNEELRLAGVIHDYLRHETGIE